MTLTTLQAAAMLLPYGESFSIKLGVTILVLTGVFRLNFQYAMLKDLIQHNIHPNIVASDTFPRDAKIADVGTGTAYAIPPSN